MNIRPQDLPELRAEVLTWQRQHGAQYFTACLRAGAQTSYQPHLTTAEEGTQLAQAEAARLTEAELFWVAPEMTELTVAAARSMPTWSLEPEDLPAPCGLIYFDGLPTARPEFPTTAMAWGPCPPEMATDALKNSGLWLSCYVARDWIEGRDELDLSHMRIPLGPLVYDGESIAAYGEREAGDIAFMSDAGQIVEVDDQTFINRCSSLVVLKAASLLMRQELAETKAIEVDRAARKRLHRAGHEPAPTRVIELRRPKTTGGSGDSDREYHHQWIVRGHWRQQWHPKRQVHRPVWIAPHIKGPEGAPLIGGEKVYALKR
ncbi:hypothetical protein [Streptomyces ossamyceticus]|uniref:hypothetical protein n=1 Tax=Streptomyces ossamyceticus TaxID=249581 RepID=UPI000B1E3AEC|nr:hypothetical protein [Streptomyces ossamyceticus]